MVPHPYPPQSSLLRSEGLSCLCQRPVPAAWTEKMDAAWQGCDLEKRTCRAMHLLKDGEGDSLVEILSQGNTTCSLLSVSRSSVPADRRCQVFNPGSFRRALVFDTNVLPAHMQNTALKKERRGRELRINPEAGFLLTSFNFPLPLAGMFHGT